MKPFLLSDALRAIGGDFRGEAADLSRVVASVTSDSRRAGPGALFVAFKGSRVDGHDFMAGCIERGAAACVSEREPAQGERPAIVTDSSLRAIGALAGWHRRRFDIPVIGITGSVGKTSTKEMLASVLEQRFNTHRTEKNFNNELGVPWTLLRLDDAHQVSVVEMGISGFGEMRRLTAMVKPTIAVFSVIGDAHLEFLGDRAGVLRAKSEIFEGMGPESLAVLNGDDPLLAACKPHMRRVLYGLSQGCDVRGEDVEDLGEAGTRLTVRHPGGAFAAHIPAFGSHLVYAALAAAVVGLELGLTGEEIARGIAAYRTVGDRARVIHAGPMTLISDCYNANPNSCRAALDSLSHMAGEKIAILGDMLELGRDTEALHREVGRYAAGAGVTRVIACGPLARHIAEGAREAGCEALWFEEKPELIRSLPDLISPDAHILVKASHSMAFEEIVDSLVSGKEEM